MELERRPPGKQELLEVDICERSAVCSEEESGVFLDSSAPSQDDTAGYPQRWPGPSESPPPGAHSTSTSTAGQEDDGARATRSSIVDCLLVELYETCGGGGRRSADSWDSSTEASGSDAFLGRSNSGSGFLQELQEKHTRRHQRNYLAQKAPAELRSIIQEVKYRTALQSAKLIRQLRRRDRLCHKLQKHYDVITACLQAVSQKRRNDMHLTGICGPQWALVSMACSCQ